MALVIIGMSKCSICGKVISKDDEILATTHFIADEKDPLWRFSDSPMHRACYERWEHRDEFTQRYRSTVRGREKKKRGSAMTARNSAWIRETLS